MKTSRTMTTLEGLMHYGTTLPKGEHLRAARKPLLEFSGVSSGTLPRWFAGKSAPLGSILVKVQVFLEFAGYELSECMHLPSNVKKMREYFAFGFINLEALQAEIGYADMQCVLRVLLGKQRTLMHNHQSQFELALSRLDDGLSGSLQIARTRLRDTLKNGRLSVPHERGVQARPIPQASKRTVLEGVTNKVGSDIALAVFRNLILAAIPLARELVSDRFSDDERRDFRNSVSHDGIFELSNLLNGLCSKRARESMLSEGEGSL